MTAVVCWDDVLEPCVRQACLSMGEQGGGDFGNRFDHVKELIRHVLLK